MKEYKFEYTKQSTAYLLFAISFGIVIAGVILFKTLLYNTVSAFTATVVVILSGLAFFLLTKRRIKNTGVAQISTTDLTIVLDKTTHIYFKDLKYYYIYNGKNGPVFTLGFFMAQNSK